MIKIQLGIKDNEVILTIAEAEALYRELNTIFGTITNIRKPGKIFPTDIPRWPLDDSPIFGPVVSK